MVVIDDQGRPEPPLAAGEAETLVGFLEFQRATLEWKCAGLDAAGLRARVGVSTMTLAGLLKHLAWVEDHWFSRQLHGAPERAPWAAVDWSADRDWEWTSALEDEPEALRGLWSDAVRRSRVLTAQALGEGGLDSVAAGSAWEEPPTLRWILVHMIEEYARLNGHADLLRESVDGEVGE